MTGSCGKSFHLVPHALAALGPVAENLTLQAYIAWPKWKMTRREGKVASGRVSAADDERIDVMQDSIFVRRLSPYPLGLSVSGKMRDSTAK